MTTRWWSLLRLKDTFTDCSSETCVEDDDGRRNVSTYRTAKTNNYIKIRGEKRFLNELLRNFSLLLPFLHKARI